jgi:hypothetical protein
MMRLFRLVNTGRVGWWVIAPTFEDAVTYSMQKKRARIASNITLVGDQTDPYLARPEGPTLQALLDSDVIGTAYLEMPGLRFADVLANAAAKAKGETPPSRPTGTWRLTP